MPTARPRLIPVFLAALLVALLLALPLAVAAADEAPATPYGGKEIVLDNGLRVFVVERSASPTFAGLYVFGVGGTMDPKGRSGIAHLLEHMMFKGTTTIGTLEPQAEAPLMARLSELWHTLHRELDKASRPFATADEEKIAALRQEIEEVSAQQKELIVKNELDELFTRAGAVGLNASTANDMTLYYVQLPANQLELWFHLESERLLDPVFREFYSERDVVAEERRLRIENQPAGKMWEALESLMFTAHPYGTPVIGWPQDLARLTREDALAYFRTYYSPSNCTLVIAGDVEAKEVERLARKYLSAWKRQDIPPPQITAEPQQEGPRRRTVAFDAEPQLMMGWPTVPEGHPDQYPIEVLGNILGGLASSRLDKTVVQEERLATAIATSSNIQKYGGYFWARALIREGHTVEEVEAAIEREIGRIAADGVSAVELERSRVRNEISRVRNLKSNLGQAFRLAIAVDLTGDTAYLERYEELINSVTAEDVQRVARTYLLPQRKSVVVLEKSAEASGATPGQPGVAHQRGAAPGERGAKHSQGFEQAMKMIRAAPPVELTVPEIGKDVDRVELPGGTVVFIKEDHAAPSIDMAMHWIGGSNSDPIATLPAFEVVGSLLDEGGTESLDPVALQERKDELGMRFFVSLGETGSYASFWSLARNFDESFDLALDILMRPRFDAQRLAILKGQYIEGMRRRFDNPGVGARLITSEVLLGDHPRLGYTPPRQAIEALQPDDLRALWRRHLGKDNLYITVVGDFEKEAMLALLRQRLGTWRDAETAEREYLSRPPAERPGVFVVEKDLPQPSVRLVHEIEVDRTAPMADHAALEILNDILGGSGFRSRLMERLRSDEGLTYGVGSSISHQGRPGVPGGFSVSYQTRRDSVARSINSVREEVQRIIAEAVSAAEVEEQIESWRNRFIFRYENDFFSVNQLMSNELDDRPYDYERRFLEAVQKVTVADVERVARRYLEPESLTVAVFGTLTPEDRAALEAELGSVTVLPREEVFTGGYDEAPQAPTGE